MVYHPRENWNPGRSLDECPLFFFDQIVQNCGHPILRGEHEPPSFRVT